MIKTISERLKESRTKLELTQPQMAEALGVPFRTYQCWEYGQRNPKPMTAEGIISKLEKLGG